MKPYDKPAQHPIEFELVDVNEAKKSLDEPIAGLNKVHDALVGHTPPHHPPADQQRAQRRHTPPPVALSPEAHAWFAQLTDEYKPHHLVEHYARLANRLALEWSTQEQALSFLEDLLVDKRGGRQGFPKPVLDELMALHTYIVQHLPIPNTVPMDPFKET